MAFTKSVCADFGRVRDSKTKVVTSKSTNTGFITVHDPKMELEEGIHTLAHEASMHMRQSIVCKDMCAF